MFSRRRRGRQAGPLWRFIPVRNEAERIEACLDAALASEGVDFEVIVMNDHSTDATADLVRARAERDPRLRLATAPPLPAGWTGKPHACLSLSRLTDRPLLLFIDADVRLAPDAAWRLAPLPDVALVSGVPRQLVRGLLQAALVPMINVLIFGYAPGFLLKKRPCWPAATVACGQMIMVRAADYHRLGGHSVVAASMHEGLKLARHFRQNGLATDFVQAADLATCQMYDGWRETWRGFGKNATEGMATLRALPIWTLLLGGGIVLPWIALAFSPNAMWGGLVCAQILARIVQKRACREPWLAVILFVPGVVLCLVLQWQALLRSGRAVSWRGRRYVPLSG